MRPEEKTAVRNLRLFESISAPCFEELLRGSFLQRFPPQVVLIREGEPADFLYVMVEGSVELFGGWKGRECTMDILRPVSTFILAAVIKDAPYLMSARTLEASRILMIPAPNLLAAMSRDNEFSLAMINELAAGFRGVVKSLKNIKLRTAVERLANYLLYLRREQGEPEIVSLPIEKRLLASYLGMSPENLSRAFNALKPCGVEVSGSQIRLASLAELRKLAAPSDMIDDPAA